MAQTLTENDEFILYLGAQSDWGMHRSIVNRAGGVALALHFDNPGNRSPDGIDSRRPG
jgi:hypothetical protein